MESPACAKTQSTNFISPSLHIYLIICNISYVKVIFHIYDTETIRTKDARNNVFFNYFQLMGVKSIEFSLKFTKNGKVGSENLRR